MSAGVDSVVGSMLAEKWRMLASRHHSPLSLSSFVQSRARAIAQRFCDGPVGEGDLPSGRWAPNLPSKS